MGALRAFRDLLDQCGANFEPQRFQSLLPLLELLLEVA